MDREAFERVYREQAGRVYRYCLFRVGDVHLAEDLTAETFARLFTVNGRVEGDHVVPWLLKVARNLAVDEARRRARTSNQPVPERGTPFPDVRIWLDTDVRDAMGRLSRVQQQVVFLRLVEDLPFSDVARAMGRGEGSTRVLYGRALRVLRRRLR